MRGSVPVQTRGRNPLLSPTGRIPNSQAQSSPRPGRSPLANEMRADSSPTTSEDGRRPRLADPYDSPQPRMDGPDDGLHLTGDQVLRLLRSFGQNVSQTELANQVLAMQTASPVAPPILPAPQVPLPTQATPARGHAGDGGGEVPVAFAHAGLPATPAPGPFLFMDPRGSGRAPPPSGGSGIDGLGAPFELRVARGAREANQQPLPLGGATTLAPRLLLGGGIQGGAEGHDPARQVRSFHSFPPEVGRLLSAADKVFPQKVIRCLELGMLEYIPLNLLTVRL
ncbi:hypothetical protein C0992_007278 [Termitomyces sp. T32_za158]|nr:hypothetical protein C0992_007278 [Termitomyces sp. T32_za158]